MRVKIYAIAAARATLLLFFSIVFSAAFALYIVLQVVEWYIGFYSAFVAETKAMLLQFDEQLKKKQ